MKPIIKYGLRNILTLSSGNAIVYAFSLISTPIMTRIYPAEEYGKFAYLNSLILILSTFSTLRLEGALLIAKDNEVGTIIKMIYFISIIVGVMGFILASTGIISDVCREYAFILPVFGILFAIQIVTNAQAIKYNFISTISRSKIVGVTIGKTTAILAPFASSPIAFWLLFSEGIAKTVEIIFCWRKTSILKVRAITYKRALKKYIKYPLFLFPSKLMVLFLTQIPISTIIYFFGNEQLGFYSVAVTILSLPSMIVIQAVAPLYVSTISKQFRETKNWNVEFVLESLFYLILFVQVPFISVSFFGEDLFSFFLGIDWISAGEYSSVLSLCYFFIFITSAIIPLLQVKKKQETIFLISFIQVLMSGLSSYLLVLLKLRLEEYLLTHSIVFSIVSLGIIIYLDKKLPLRLPLKIYYLISIFIVFYIISYHASSI